MTTSQQQDILKLLHVNKHQLNNSKFMRLYDLYTYLSTFVLLSMRQ